MKNLLLATVATVAIIGANAPALALDQAAFDAQIEAITAKYDPKFEVLERRINALDDNMPSKEEMFINVDLSEMEEVRFSMHIPEFSMKRWEFSMDIPEFKMKLRQFSWDIPKCDWDMVDFGIGKTKFLKCSKHRHEWSTKIPEVSMEVRKLSMDIPVVSMKQRDFSFHLPKISIGGPRDHVEKMKLSGEAIQTEASLLRAQMDTEIREQVRAFLLTSRSEAEKQFQFGLDMFDVGISSAPDVGVKTQLEAQRSELLQKRMQVLDEIDVQLSRLS